MNLKFDKISTEVIKLVKTHHKIILGISLIYFFSNCFLGLDFTDGFFHINAASQIKGTYPFETLLTSQILHFLFVLFGKHLIVYRCCNAILTLLGFCILSKSSKGIIINSNRNLMLAAFLILASPIINNIFGYDSLSLLMLIIIVSFLFHYSLDTIKNLLVLSTLIGLFILIRIPNIIIIPFISIYLFASYKEKSWSIIKTTGVFIFVVVGTIIFYLSWLLIYYGSLSTAFSTFSSVDDHDFILLIKNYLRDSIRIICYLTLLTASYFWIINKKSNQRFLFMFLQFVFLYAFIFNTPYVWNYTLFLTAFNCSFITILFIKEKKINYLYLFVLLSSMVLSIGSNTGLSKTSTFGTFGFLFCLETFKKIDRIYLISWLFVLIPFSFFENAGWTYEDGNLFRLRKTINIEGLNPILTTEKHYRYIHTIIEKSDVLKKEGYQVIYFGYYSHLFTFLNPAKRQFYSFDQRFGSSKEIESILKEYSKNKIAIFITDNIGYQKRKDITYVEKLLLEKRFTIDTDERFTIYKSPN